MVVLFWDFVVEWVWVAGVDRSLASLCTFGRFRTCYIDQAGLDPLVFPECWDHRFAPPHLVVRSSID